MTQREKDQRIRLAEEQLNQLNNCTVDEVTLEIKYAGKVYRPDVVDYTLEPLVGNADSLIMQTGMYRQTKELSERSAKAMLQRNRLEELVHWLEPDYIPNWSNGLSSKYFIYFNIILNKFFVGSDCMDNIIGAVYMSEETAKQICDALNTGKLEELADILKL